MKYAASLLVLGHLVVYGALELGLDIALVSTKCDSLGYSRERAQESMKGDKNLFTEGIIKEPVMGRAYSGFCTSEAGSE